MDQREEGYHTEKQAADDTAASIPQGSGWPISILSRIDASSTRWISSHFVLHARPRPTIGTALVYLSIIAWAAMWILIVLISNRMNGEILGGELQTVSIKTIVRAGLAMMLPGMWILAGHKRLAWLLPALWLLGILLIGGTLSWNAGDYDVSLGLWHHDLFYPGSNRIAPFQTENSGLLCAPLDWLWSRIIRSGWFGNSSLLLVWIQAFAIVLSAPLLSRLLRLNLDRYPRVIGIILIAYAISPSWFPLLIYAGTACLLPALMFSMLWAFERCHRKRAAFYTFMILCTGFPASLMLWGLAFRYALLGRIRTGIFTFAAGFLFVWIFPCYSQIPPTESITWLGQFSAHDRSIIDLILNWSFLPLLLPHIVATGIPAVLYALWTVPPSQPWPGHWAVIILPIAAYASGRVLWRWRQKRMAYLWVPAFLLFALANVKAYENWPGFLEQLQQTEQEQEEARLCGEFTNWLEEQLNRSNNAAVPERFFEQVSQFERIEVFPHGWQEADIVLAGHHPNNAPWMPPEDYRRALLAIHRHPDWGMVDRAGEMFLFIRNEPDRVEILFDEDRWNSCASLIEVPHQVRPGEVFSGTIQITNCGHETWAGKEGFAIGTENNPFVPGGTARIPIIVPVTSGRTAEFVLPEMTAPDSPGAYKMRWQMLQEDIRWFGEIVEVTIQVSSSLESG